MTQTTETLPAQADLKPADAAWSCRFCGSGSGVTVLDAGSQPASDLFPAPSRSGARPRASAGHGDVHRLPPCPAGERPDDTGGATRCRAGRAHRPGGGGGRPGRQLRATFGPGTRVFEYPSPHGGSWVEQLARRDMVEVTEGKAELLVDIFGMMHDADQRAALEERISHMSRRRRSLDAVPHRCGDRPLRHLERLAPWAFCVLLDARPGRDGPSARADRDRGLGVLAVRRHTAACLRQGWLPLGRPGRRRYRDDRARGRRGDSRPGVRRIAWARRCRVQCRRSRPTWRKPQIRMCRSAGYGAASRTSALLRCAHITKDQVVALADAATGKHGRTMPGNRIPIVSPADLVELRPERVLLFVPDLLPEVRKALPAIESNGGRWVVLDPMPREVEPVA